MLKKLLSIIKNKKHHTSIIIIASFMVYIIAGLIFNEQFIFVNSKLNDYFFRLRYTFWGAEPIDKKLIHVDLVDHDIDAAALGIGHSSTDRSFFAEILNIITESGARMVGVDTIFDKKTYHEADHQLITSTRRAKNVYYPVAFNWQGKKSQDYKPVFDTFIVTPVINPLRQSGRPLDGGFLYMPFDTLQESARGLGHINSNADPDGIIRTIPLIIAYDQEKDLYVPALGLIMLCDYLGIDPDTITVTFGKHIILSDAVIPGNPPRDITIPIDTQGKMRINWAAPWNASFPHYSTEKLILAGIEPSFKPLIEEAINDKIVIISDISIRSKDRSNGVFNKIFPLSSVHTNVMNTILTQNFIKEISMAGIMVRLLLLITILCVAGYFLKPLPFMAVSILIFGAYFVANLLGFVYLNQLGCLLISSLGFGTSFIILAWYNLYREQEEKITIRERSNLKTNFFINIAHETKTPLTLILNYLDAYIDKKGMDSELMVIKQNIDKMARDMLNFMDAEALQMGKAVYQHDTIINIGTFLRNKQCIFQEAYNKKEVELSYTGTDTVHFIKINPGALDRIMNNLLDNALKYTDKGGHVSIVLAVMNNAIRISVRDTGMGIDNEESGKIFMPYYRIAQSKKSIHGMGMGLHIVNTIISRLGGTLTVKSTPGKGSVFSVTLPAYTPKPGDRIYEEAPFSDLVLRPVTPELPVRAFDENKYTLVVVENNPQLLASLYNELIGDYNVVYAYNGKEALEKLKTTVRPDIIISDILMDEMDGYTLYKNLLKDSTYHSIPFIFITAKSGPDEKIKALDMGAVDFINKPFRIGELKAKISALINLQVSHKLDFNDNMDTYKQNKMDGLFEQYGITPTERKIILQLLEGKQNKEIAAILGVKETTVKYHLSNVFRKCDVQNRVEVTHIFNQ